MQQSTLGPNISSHVSWMQQESKLGVIPPTNAQSYVPNNVMREYMPDQGSTQKIHTSDRPMQMSMIKPNETPRMIDFDER